MRYWALLFFTLWAIPVHAGTTLYEALKSLPQPYVKPSFELFPDGTIRPAENILSTDFNRYLMSEMLQKQFMHLTLEQMKIILSNMLM
jgi:hypothetical protein